ncbi:MAG: cytochrome c1 [Alphaproteobacteria bacterium]|nr:cytochrome c1 [Alphaproteobacteria bacterium]
MAAPAFASGSKAAPKRVDWTFDGVFGRVDTPSIQRGFQVYKEVCSACHGLKRVSFRQLEAIGFSAAEVKSLAASYTVKDGPNDAGDMFERPGRPSDYLPSPYANDNAGRAANNGALPPDQSLIIKAREDGANYIYSLLTGYGSPVPEDVVLPAGASYNPYFDGHIIKMMPPLREDSVTYQDGTAATLEQQAYDIVNFLQWAAEPEMEQRKSMGIHVMLFLGIMTLFFYLVKKRIWSNLH